MTKIPQRDERNIDKWVMRLALLGILIFFILLYKDEWLFSSLYQNKNDQLVKIGVSDQLQRDVRRRSLDEFVWLPLNTKTDLFLGDSIFTGDKSHAVIRLDSGMELNVDSNSLLVLDKIENMTKLDIRFGKVTGSIEEGADQNIKLSFGNQQIDLDGKKLNFFVENTLSNESSLQILKGEASVKSGEQSIKLGKNKKLNLGRSLASTGALVPIDGLPQGGFVNTEKWSGAKEVWLNKKGFMTFRWETSPVVAKSEIVVSGTESLEAPFVKSFTERKDFRWQPPLPAGVYYWKLKSFDREGNPLGESPLNRWTIGLLEAPHWVDPSNPIYRSPWDKSGGSPQKTGDKDLEWALSGKVDSFTLQWSSDSEFQSFQTVNTKKRIWSTPSWDRGRYYVRVRSESLNRPSSPWSDVKTVEVSDRDPEGLVPPELDLAEMESEVGKTSPPLAWKPQEKTKNYLVEVSDQANFSKVVISNSLQTEKWNGTLNKKGAYFVRVIALGAGARRGPSSKTLNWWVRVKGPQWKDKEKSRMLLALTGEAPQDGTAKKQRTLEWFQPAGGPPPSQYVLQWGPNLETTPTDQSRTDSINGASGATNGALQKQTQDKNSYEVLFKDLGTYYFQVRSVFPDGSLSLKSEPYKVIVFDASTGGLEAPQMVTEELVTKKVADQLAAVSVQWKPVQKAASYKIQLSSMKDYRSLISEKTSRSSSLTLKVKDAASYYVRVAALNSAGLVGPWSQTVPWKVEEGAPVLSPIPPIKLQLKNKDEVIAPRKINVQWKASSSIKQFNLEVSKNKKFDGLFFQQNVKGMGSVFNVKEAGTYWVRVTGINEKNNAITDSSDLVGAEFVVLIPIPKPQLLGPRDKTSYILSKMKNPQVWLEWKGDGSSLSYRIQFSLNKNFSKIMHSAETDDERLIIDHKAVRGKVYWRVQAVDKKWNLESPWSDAWSLSVVDIENED